MHLKMVYLQSSYFSRNSVTVQHVERGYRHEYRANICPSYCFCISPDFGMNYLVVNSKASKAFLTLLKSIPTMLTQKDIHQLNNIIDGNCKMMALLSIQTLCAWSFPILSSQWLLNITFPTTILTWRAIEQRAEEGPTFEPSRSVQYRLRVVIQWSATFVYSIFIILIFLQINDDLSFGM